MTDRYSAAEEEWRSIPGFPGYEVSSTGRVLSRRRRNPIELRLSHDTSGYLQACLMRDGRSLTRRLHILVASAFIGPRPEGMETRHLDGDKDNCRATNLAYGTKSQNTLDQVCHGTHAQASKTECINGHAFTELNTRATGGRRFCRACDRAKAARYRTRRAFRAAGIEAAA